MPPAKVQSSPSSAWPENESENCGLLSRGDDGSYANTGAGRSTGRDVVLGGIRCDGDRSLAVAIIVVAILMATVSIIEDRGAAGGQSTYNDYRHKVGRALILGLEILVAADIIRTVVLEPTLANVLVLGLLVLIRTFLSWALVLEIEERWPWQRRRAAERLAALEVQTFKSFKTFKSSKTVSRFRARRAHNGNPFFPEVLMANQIPPWILPPS